MIGSGTAIQWHFVDSEDPISLSEYTNDRYHLWKDGEVPGHELENVRKAIRTYVGWSDYFQIQLTAVNPSDVMESNLHEAGSQLVLKNIGLNSNFGRSPATVGFSAAFEVQKGTVKHTREPEFHEVIIRSTTTPVLLYAPDEGRGWLVPQLSVLECMARININRYGNSDSLAPQNLDLDATKEKLLTNLQDPTLKRLLNVDDGITAKTNTFRLRQLLCLLAQGLDWAEEHARHQRKWLPRIMGDDIIYGLEFYKLALRDAKHHVKKGTLNCHHGGWVKLLDDRIVKGVVFCKGLGDVVVCHSSCPSCKIVPREHGYLAAVIPCLEHLTKHGRLPSGSWSFRNTAFE